MLNQVTEVFGEFGDEKDEYISGVLEAGDVRWYLMQGGIWWKDDFIDGAEKAYRDASHLGTIQYIS